MKRSEINAPYGVLMRLPFDTVLDLAWTALWFGFEESSDHAGHVLRKRVEEILRPYVIRGDDRV